MGEVITGVVSLGLGVALSPLPIIVMFMILTSSAVSVGACFLLGRVIGLVSVVALLAPFADLLDDAVGSTAPAAILRLLVGVSLIIWATTQFASRRERSEKPSLPAWIRAIDGASAAGSFRIGLVVTVLNLKEVALAAAAGLMIGGAMLDAGSMAVAGAVFVGISCASVLLPMAAMALFRARIAPTLTRARNGLIRHNKMIVATLLFLIGVALAINSIVDLI